MPVDRMLSEMSSVALTEYMAFDRIEPIGETRADLRAGIIASTVANHSMSPPKHPARPVDFMPFVKKPDGAVLIKDPAQHGKLLANSLFGKLPDKT